MITSCYLVCILSDYSSFHSIQINKCNVNNDNILAERSVFRISIYCYVFPLNQSKYSSDYMNLEKLNLFFIFNFGLRVGFSDNFSRYLKIHYVNEEKLQLFSWFIFFFISRTVNWVEFSNLLIKYYVIIKQYKSY